MAEHGPAFHKYPMGTFTRLKKAPAESLVRYEFAPVWAIQKPLFAEHLMVNMAWVVMLAEREVIQRDEAGAILSVLRKMEAEGADRFDFDPKVGDVYFNIESQVIEQVGEAIGGRLYMGRSRIDHEPSTKRLFLRRRIIDVAEALVGLAETCLGLGERHTETVMPGYTGCQPAQPWTLGHYFLSFSDAFSRDFERLQSAYPRANKSVLGTGTGAGSNLPLDRKRAAQLLGFDGFIENSREFYTSVDAYAEVTGVCSILLAHLGQLAQDLHLWSTQEFRMVELGDEFCGSSSFMPQKKNPTPFYIVRATAGGSVGLMPAVLSVMRTCSSDFDLDSDAIFRPVLSAVQQAQEMTAFMSDALATLEVHADLMRERALNEWTTTSEIATLIVQERGLAWRTAHRITERFARLAIVEKGVSPHEVTGEMLDQAAIEIDGKPLGLSSEAIQNALDPLTFIRSRQTAGSPNPVESGRMLVDRRTWWDERRRWCETRRVEHSTAREALREAVGTFL